jgi:hypothetical protein
LVGASAVGSRHRRDQDDPAEHGQPGSCRERTNLWRHLVDADSKQFLRIWACRCLGRGKFRDDIDSNAYADSSDNTYGNTYASRNALADSHPHTDTDTSRNALADGHPHTDTDTSRNALTNGHAHTDTSRNALTNGHSHADTYSSRDAFADSHPHTDAYSSRNALANSHPYAHIHSNRYGPANSYTDAFNSRANTNPLSTKPDSDRYTHPNPSGPGHQSVDPYASSDRW